MAKEKKPTPKKEKIETPPPPKVEKPAVEVSAEGSSDPIMGFYLRSVLLGAALFGFLWYVVVNNYQDMGEAGKLAQAAQAGQQLSEHQRMQLQNANKYQYTSDYKWFYNYKWVYHNLLNKNLEIQNNLDTLNWEQRQSYKIGVEYQYLKILKDSTPENAVIIMPDEADLAIPEGAPAGTPKFILLSDKAWCYYFLYPRTLVYDEYDSKDSLNGKINFRKDPEYAEKRKRATHVAIVYGKGYHKLNYETTPTSGYTVLPINKPEGK